MDFTATYVVQSVLNFLTTDFIRAILIIAIAVLLFVAFAVTVFVGAYALAFLWAGYENQFRKGDEDEFVFNEESIYIVLVQHWTAFLLALDELLNLALAAITTIINTLVNNYVGVAVFILAFALYIIWDSWHNILIPSFAQQYTCYVSALVRTLILPTLDLIGFVIQSLLPASNAARQIINSVTIGTILRAIVCGVTILQQIIALLALAFTQFLFAIVAWGRTANTPTNAILDVGPNFIPATTTLGLALGRFDQVFTCACEPAGPILIEPLFQPFRSTAFQNATNATLALPFVFISQGFARPIYRSVQNFKKGSGVPFLQTLSRPSFNSTFDTATRVLNQTGATFTAFTYAAINVTINIAEAVVSACPPQAGWQRNGTCNSTSPAAQGFCQGAVCRVFAVKPGVPANSSYANSITDFSCNKTLTCFANSPPTTRCTCLDCFCTYAYIDPFSGNTTSLLAVGPCNSARNATTCAADVPTIAKVPAPTYNFWGGVLGLIDAMFIQPFRYLFNILFQIDIVFTLDGFLLFNYDYGIERFNWAVTAFFGDINWLGDFFVALGKQSAASDTTLIEQTPALGPMVFDSRKISPASKQAIGLYSYARLQKTKMQAGSAMQLAYNFIAELLYSLGRIVLAFFIFLERLIFNEQYYVFFGTIYYTINSAIVAQPQLRIDPLSYEKFRWGDNATSGIAYECGYVGNVQIGNPGQFTSVFRERVTNASAITCNEQEELLDFCRFVFQRVQAKNITSTNTTDIGLEVKPSFIEVTRGANGPYSDAAVQTCLLRVTNCVPSIVFSQIQQVKIENAINEFNVTLQAGVDIFRAIDPLVGVFCPNCTVIQNFISNFIEPLVPVILVFIDPIVHVEKFFTTAYLRCIDIEGALRAFNSFTINITNIFRLINERITGTVCLPGNNARDSRILCAFAQGLDSFVDVWVQLGIQIWRFVQLLLSIVTGTVPPATVANSITFEPVYGDIENLVFAGLSVFAQVIPAQYNCTEIPVSFPNGCCFNEPIAGVFNCRDNTTVTTGCQDPSVIGFGPNSTWLLGVQCADAFPTQCMPKTVQATVAANAAASIAEFIIVWFRILSNVLTTVINTLASGDFLNIFGNVIAAVLRPLGQLVSNFFFNLANVLECLGAADFAATFRQIGGVFVLITTVGIKALVAMIQFFVFLIAGIVQVLITGETTLLKSAFDILGQFLVFVLIAMFGENFICGLQDAACFITFGTVNFAINACSALTPPYQFQFCQTFGSARPNGLQCIGDDISCVVECPDFPLGCCGALPFPPNGASSTNLTNSDSRYTCKNKMNQNPIFERCFAGTIPLADLKLCYGQPHPDTNCRLFQNNTECENIVFIDPVTGNVIPSTRKRSETAWDDHMRAARRHQHSDDWTPSESFCGSFLAAYGFDRAHRESTLRRPLQQDDKSEDFKVAARCYELAKTQSVPIKEQVHEALLEIIGSYLSPLIETSRKLQTHATEHWKSMAREAHEQAEHYRQTGEHHPTKRSLDRRIAEYHASEQERPLGRLEVRGGRFIFEHGAAVQRQIVVGTMAALITWNRALERQEYEQVTSRFKAAVKARDEITKYSASHKTSQQAFADDANKPLTVWDQRYIGARLIYYRARNYINSLTANGGEIIGNFVNLFGSYNEQSGTFTHRVPIDRSAQHQQEAAALNRLRGSAFVNTYRLRFAENNATTIADLQSGRKLSLLATTFQGQPISNDTLANLGLFVCNASTAVLCSGCYILDAGVNTVALAGNGFIDYFQNNVTGFGRQNEIFQKQINTTLFDPIGTDVYTTVNKTTPFIGARFFTIDWPTQWNYSELQSILALGNGSANIADFDNLTDSIQILRSAQVGRPDQDIEIYNVFRVVLTPIVSALERVVNAIYNSTTLAVLQAIFNRYIACDYQGALVCSSTLGIGLFNALAVTTVGYLILMAVATVVFPGTQVLVGRVLNVLYPFVVLWLAYGASPLCTVMSIFGGIRGIPACLPVDITQLISEIFPQCPYLPPSLIDPRDLAEASVTLCAECGTAPRMLSCATAVGFLNGFDVFFYLNAINGRTALNQRIAEATDIILPDVSALAKLYTPAYAESLGPAGLECSGILFFGIFIAAATLAFRAARVILIAGGVAFFVFGVILATVAAIFAANYLLLQMEEGFVHGVLVRKLRIKPTSSPNRKTDLETLEKLE